MAIGEILEPTGWLGEADKIAAPADQFPTSGLEKMGRRTRKNDTNMLSRRNSDE
jgi:hypothetical protein